MNESAFTCFQFLKVQINSENTFSDYNTVCDNKNVDLKVSKKTMSSVTIGDMTYVREVTETDLYNCMYLYF